MAQTKEQTPPAVKSPPKGAQKATAPTPTTPPATSPAPKGNWLSRLRPPLTTAPTANGKPRQRAGGTLFKSFFGILIWFIASQFIMYVLLIVDGWLTQPGQKPPLETLHLLPPNTPLLGWVTPFLLLYGGAVIGLWFLLIRFNLIPRDFFGARAQAQARAQRQATGGSTSNKTATGASTGPRKTRAQRRYAETLAQIQAQASAKGAKGGKNGAKPTAAAKAAPKPVATAKGSETGKNASASAAKGTNGAGSANGASAAHDSEYAQVRSADRLRRRRQAKR
ncbi:MAG TPA: hypothetical protein VFS83_07325 [Ktedonobacterales bacterium]|nr:hypothetical protein [Ktedonobacterales bacterium]